MGFKLGKLTISGYLGPVPSKKFHKYKVTCLCGEEKVITSDNLFRGHRSSKSCGCNRLKASPETSQLNSAFDGFLRSAHKRQLYVGITKEQWLLLSQQECHYCGLKYSNARKPAGRCKHARPFRYNGIDRLDSAKDYVLENCVACCKDCNYAKRLLSKNDFISMARRIVFHQDSESLNV